MLFETLILNKLTNNKLSELIQKPEETIENYSNSDTVAWTLIAIYLILVFFYSYGASRLSWAYNTYYSNSLIIKILYSIFAFIFAGIYYPMYAWFLNPLGSLRNNTISNITNSQRRALNKIL
jgi:hypothetical protein